MTERVFVIGDIHGCAETLNELLNNVCRITKNDRLVFLGDFIDRGPYSKKVIDTLIGLIQAGYDVIPLRGNHEQMLIDAMNLPKAMKDWFRNGGQTTLDSFEVFHPGFLDEKYIEFFLSTRYYYETDEYVIVHAGMDFEIANPFRDKAKMLWVRNSSIDKEKIGDRRLIVGHTPTPLDKIKESLNRDLIKLDGGCVYHKRIKDLGFLVALELNSFELFYLRNIDF